MPFHLVPCLTRVQVQRIVLAERDERGRVVVRPKHRPTRTDEEEHREWWRSRGLQDYQVRARWRQLRAAARAKGVAGG